MIPKVVKSWPVPSPNASTSSVTTISDETMRPKPARCSRSAYSPACQKTSTVTSATKGSHFALGGPQDTPEDRRVAVVHLADRERGVEREPDGDEVDRDQGDHARTAEEEVAERSRREQVRAAAPDVAGDRRAGRLPVAGSGNVGRRGFLCCHGTIEFTRAPFWHSSPVSRLEQIEQVYREHHEARRPKDFVFCGAGTPGDLPRMGRHRRAGARRRLPLRGAHARLRRGEPGRRDRCRPGGARGGGQARNRADLGRRGRAVPARRRELRRRRPRRAARAPAGAGAHRRRGASRPAARRAGWSARCPTPFG